MQLLALAAAAAAAISSPAISSPPPFREFRIDAGHSDVAFSIGFLGHPVRGRFDDIRGTIIYAPENVPASAITVVIGVKSITTGSAHRDEHLKSPDFFDAAKYPSIVFRSTSIEKRGASLIANGVLTMHGVQRAVSIPFRETSPMVADPHGSTLVFFTGALRIARKDYGILGGSKYNDWFDELRSATMADSVDITLDVSGWDPDIDRTRRYDAPIQRMEKEGVASTLTRLRTLKANFPDSLKSSAYDVEQIARGLLEHGRTADALSLFRFNVEAFGDSAPAHAALARAFEIAGNPDSSKAHAMRAIAIDSLDTRALELGRRLGLVRVTPPR
jgi:polyisoprenoid-binding protein YceI